MSDEIFRNHEILFKSDTALKLGKAHYLILKATTTLDDQTIILLDAGAPFSRIEYTPLGVEINDSFVKWFLRKHINDIGILKTKFEEILPALVDLKHLSENIISESKAENYEEFLNELRILVERKKIEVNKFSEFVVWLEQLDDLAPCLLFSHHPWSTSEISDRSFTIRKDNDECSLNLCIEIVFGLTEICHPIGPIPILASQRSDEESSWSSSVDPEEWGNRPSPITFQTVFHKASRSILKEFSTYFQKIRDAAEIVIDEISNLNRGELLTNDVFLGLFVTKALPSHIQENKVWDFKRTYETWHNSGVEQLKVKLASDIAAFANNRGGLLLIGISDNREIEGLTNIEAKKLGTQEILQSYFVSGSESVMFHNIKLIGKNGTPVECLVIIIPQTKDVIDVKKSLGTKETLCPFRISSGIEFKYHPEVES